MDDPRTRPGKPLSPRQLEALQHMAQGRTDEQTGRVMHIAPKTVNYLLWQAQMRLEARNRPHAVLLAVGKGLLLTNRFDASILPITPTGDCQET